MRGSMKARARACANIALAKYWGKSDTGRNLTAVPSLSVTLDGLVTETEVEFVPGLPRDEVELDGLPATGRVLERAVLLLDRVRALAGSTARARVRSHNAFPTAAGLASSASGFAALAVACDAALGLSLGRAQLSALARQSSASAARSLFGGYVELLAEADSAAPVASAQDFPLELLVAVSARGPKKLGSTEAMERTRDTSPYYAAWLEAAPRLFAQVKQGVLARDLNALGPAMEHSTLLMHGSALCAVPSVRYAEPVTVALLQRVEALREEGVPAYYTMDAGPHVKVLLAPQHAERAQTALSAVPGVLDVLRCQIGGEPSVERIA